MPPCRRHPQIPMSAQTGTQNFDTYFSFLFMVLTCEPMTIKHSIYMWKVPFLCTERACVFFGIEIHSRRKMTCSEVLQVLQTRGSISARGESPDEAL